MFDIARTCQYIRSLIHDEGEQKMGNTALVMSLNYALLHFSIKLSKGGHKFYLEIATSQTLTASTRIYTLPDGVTVTPRCNGLCSHIDPLNSSGKAKLFPFFNVAVEKFQSAMTGTPTAADVVGRKIYFNSIPSSNMLFDLYYYRVPTEVDDVTSTAMPDIPDGLNEAVCYRVARMWATRTKQVDPNKYMFDEEGAIATVSGNQMIAVEDVETNLPPQDDDPYGYEII